jgi:CHAD domain-containing protein
MKRSKIITVVKNSFHKLDKLFTGVIIDFEIESIHDFRTEIKKLRAFLRLLNTQSKKGLSISKKIKQFYDCIGDIRNLQLHIESVKEFVKNSNDKFPPTYLQKLNAEIELYKTDSIKLIDHKILSKNFKKIIYHLPLGIKKKTIENFIHEKLSELKQLLTNMQDDEVLHSIRKNLKDILYTWSTVKPYRDLLPEAISKKNNIQSLTDILGDFCDKKNGIELLARYCSQIIANKENELLQKIIQKWKEEKLNLKQQIFYYLRLI